MSWIETTLGEECELYQPKTLSKNELKDNGKYCVYGANGIIGMHDEYNHEEPQVLITCRGATCGTINVSKPKSWINGNAMVVKPKKNNIDSNFLSNYLNFIDMSMVITGAAQPQITRQSLSPLKIKLPPLAEQKRIAEILDKANEIKAQRELALAKLDELVNSTFIDIFGESSKNSKGWEKVALKNFGRISTGNTPPRANSKNYDEQFIEWIKTDNIPEKSIYITSAKEYLSQHGAINGRIVKKDALLVACIAGSVDSIGRASLTNREVAFNQQINAIEPNEDITPLFLYSLFKVSRAYLQSHATSGMKKLLSKGDFEKIEMIKPPIALQNKFADDLKLINNLRDKFMGSAVQINLLLNSLQKQAFTTGFNA